MQGSDNGRVIEPGDPDASLLIQIQSGEISHFGQFTPDELEFMIQWIASGAPEK
jgi:hypothetical protein